MDGLRLRAGATPRQIEAAEQGVGVRFPDDYRAFLESSDGAEGFVGPESYVMLWSVADVIELNRGYSVAEFARGMVLIGSDGADTGYGFVSDGSGVRYVRTPLVGLSRESEQSLGASLAELLSRVR